ncbi:carbamoyltransferase [Erythrobacter arachoides]|uniref:Carbamoyltransferase n=1 Tax=Aurantiacibacter arachoides TaxID=1850444 RepID=A0A845A361_9SPHN|nr:carbamoyltransferase C-terminal domain-containing protein [Aurantiacibacter arachoides]MXO93377.1 carbamoyltransferase [Aurantiacibacter arachoides]GGD49867.1 carbamoyltransferase [Aurantiacibacter arachoides]
MTAILGLNAFHADSAACLVIDGKLVGAVAEERLGNRLKHTSEFPANAVRWLLADNGLKLSDIDYVALPRDTRANRAAKAAYIAGNPVRGMRAAMEHLRRSSTTQSMIEKLAEICGEDPATVTFETVPVEHHLAHVASSYYCSPFDGLTAGFSYDASGDFASAMAVRCEGARVDVLDRVTLPHSLGFFYTALCQYIGFDSFGEEYKVMGLAPYGEDKYADVMQKLVVLPDDGFFRLGKGYFGMHEGGQSGEMTDDGHLVMGRLFTEKLVAELGPKTERGAVTQREMDIAKSVQVRFEQAAIHSLNRMHRLVPSEQLVMAGGCALNGVANARILRDTPFTTPYLQAAASDDGTCLGAAMWTWHNVVGSTERFHMKHGFWGPEYSDEDMRRTAQSAGLHVIECADEDEVVERVAKLIADGVVLGWYQGRSEWGPRALGNRSILANPAIRTMKETINAKIKRRESFRPFAPSVLQEDVGVYFEQDIYSPFMMHVTKLKPEYRDALPAITHVDGTGRLQSVDPDSNALYYKLISKVKQHTGFGVVLNTSFNENEPVVDTPQQALDCFLRTDMDALCLGRFIVEKSGVN